MVVGGRRPPRVAQEAGSLVVGVARRPAAVVLQHDRHAPERTVGKPGFDGSASLVEEGMDDGVQRWVRVLDPGDGPVDQLERRHLAGADSGGLRSRVRLGDVDVGHHAPGLTRRELSSAPPVAP